MPLPKDSCPQSPLLQPPAPADWSPWPTNPLPTVCTPSVTSSPLAPLPRKGPHLCSQTSRPATSLSPLSWRPLPSSSTVFSQILPTPAAQGSPLFLLPRYCSPPDPTGRTCWVPITSQVLHWGWGAAVRETREPSDLPGPSVLQGHRVSLGLVWSFSSSLCPSPWVISSVPMDLNILK